MAPDRGDVEPEGSRRRGSSSTAGYNPLISADRGSGESEDFAHGGEGPYGSRSLGDQDDEDAGDGADQPKYHEAPGHHFTTRGVLVGIGVGILIVLSNTFFGLQTGWISGMTMPASLIGFAVFKAAGKHLSYPFTPVEHVLIQTVASSVGTMPLAAGFVGVVPAIEYLLRPDEGGPINISIPRLMAWSIGLSVFGALFAVPLRKEVIIRERLKFPSGTATALLIRVLHGNRDELAARGVDEGGATLRRRRTRQRRREDGDGEESRSLLRMSSSVDQAQAESLSQQVSRTPSAPLGSSLASRDGWLSQTRMLIWSFVGSGTYTLFAYFLPVLRKLPIFGQRLGQDWLWNFNPSPAYVGQGIIMGTVTTLHMLFGAVVGWGILSPLAKKMEWAPGPVSSWEDGSKGWIIWISLAIMLADSIISLGWLCLKPLIKHVPSLVGAVKSKGTSGNWKRLNPFGHHSPKGSYSSLHGPEEASGSTLVRQSSHSMRSSVKEGPRSNFDTEDSVELDAPPAHLIGTKTVVVGLIGSLALCTVTINVTFPSVLPLYATLLSLFLALLLSIMGVRALGETDLNPVSGISKLTQLFFALIITPASTPAAALINLIAGAVSEAGALQAGEMMQDLKTGHIIGASPKAQFYGQLIGSIVGSVVSALVYRMYTTVYEIPGDLFQIPTGYLWIFTARLVTGSGLPPKAWEFSLGAGIIFVGLTIVRIIARERGATWQKYVPGGIAVAVGMYNVPSFTLARTVGGFLHLYWVSPYSNKLSRWFRKRRGLLNEAENAGGSENDDANSDGKGQNRDEIPVVVLASGLILGEGVMSIVNLALASLSVPHL
ncbi:MAG: regulator of (H+)-ATPase in vacuolar membrane [Chaenotheca gracillima]|nr:MAG: regulator of (H+)-ATPase in vacuolar membrane [Chaenotheca gracillima]